MNEVERSQARFGSVHLTKVRTKPTPTNVGEPARTADQRPAAAPMRPQMRLGLGNAGQLREGANRRFRRSRAVAVGFEPTVELPPHTLSRRAP